DVEGRVDSGTHIEMKHMAFPAHTIFPAFDEKSLAPVIGPVSWKIVLYNDMDRSVTVRTIETFFLDHNGNPAYYSGLQAAVLDGSSPATTQALPFVIKSREAKAIILSLNIPVYPQNDGKPPCLKSGVLLREVEKCFFMQGRDLFGNSVQTTIFPDN